MIFIAYCFISIFLSLAYFLIINFYRFHWNRLPVFEIPTKYQPKTSITVIVPARNESDHIINCLASIKRQSYPSDLFEVIVVDDHSDDNTAQLVLDSNLERVRLIKLSDGITGKKKAIATAIQSAQGTLIVTTDADCIVPNKWLDYFAAYYQAHQAQFVAAPVTFYGERNLLEYFQSLDFLGMMLITGAGIKSQFMHMSNGANLAYPKQLFLDLEGFQGIDKIASGDDILFMQKVAKAFPGKLGFIKNKEAAVNTPPASTLKAFIQQRIRWGTKSNQYEDWQITVVLALVFFFCWNIMLSLLLFPFLGWKVILIFLLQILSKSWIDYYFLGQASHFFGRADLMRFFLPSQFLHICYIAFVGLMSNVFKTYEWKGRKVK